MSVRIVLDSPVSSRTLSTVSTRCAATASHRRSPGRAPVQDAVGDVLEEERAPQQGDGLMFAAGGVVRVDEVDDAGDAGGVEAHDVHVDVDPAVGVEHEEACQVALLHLGVEQLEDVDERVVALVQELAHLAERPDAEADEAVPLRAEPRHDARLQRRRRRCVGVALIEPQGVHERRLQAARVPCLCRRVALWRVALWRVATWHATWLGFWLGFWRVRHRVCVAGCVCVGA